MAATYRLSLGGHEHEVTIDSEDGRTVVQIDGARLHADFERVDGPLFSLLLDGRSYEVVAQERADGVDVVLGDRAYEIDLVRPGRGGAAGATAGAGEQQLKTGLTGTVVEVRVAAGESVMQGQVVVIVESMKMNNEIRASRDGVVREIRVKAGDRVERNAVLATIA
jgi:biotin carboxyl carrier protein